MGVSDDETLSQIRQKGSGGKKSKEIASRDIWMTPNIQLFIWKSKRSELRTLLAHFFQNRHNHLIKTTPI